MHPRTVPLATARPARPTQVSPKPLTPSHGGASHRPGRRSRRKLRQHPLHPPTVPLPAGTADAGSAKTPYTPARWRFRPARPAQPTHAPPTPLAPWHGGASDRPGRHSRRTLRQHPVHRGTVALPTGPAGTADARSANTPCTVALVALPPPRRHLPRQPCRKHSETPIRPARPRPTSAGAVRTAGTSCTLARCGSRAAIPLGRFAAPPPTTWRHTSWRRRSRARLAGQS